MNVFVLCTGRCGSLTFAKACKHITNYTSGHESKIHDAGSERLRFPDNHIEVDNRLSWFLGCLHYLYGNDAFYVHLKRNDEDTAKSFLNKYIKSGSIITAYNRGIYLTQQTLNPFELCFDYVNTVNCNIEMFLEDKTKIMTFELEYAKNDFVIFWHRIHAEGDLNAALKEWEVKYNKSL